MYREEQPLAHGLFLARNVWFILFLLLFYVAPDKSQEQVTNVASNIPDVPMAPLHGKWYMHLLYWDYGFSYVSRAFWKENNSEVAVAMSWQQRSILCEQKLHM